jgi:hypothetical protein
MGFSSNFTRVRLQTAEGTDESVLVVDGRSDPADGKGDIHVAIPRGGTLFTATVNPAGLSDWSAPFPELTPPFAPGEDAFVVGVAMRPGPCDPFVWQGSFAVVEEPRR